MSSRPAGQTPSPTNVSRPSPGAPPATSATASRGLLLLGLSLGYFMVMLDTTVVTVALPAIGADLSGSLSGLQWVSNGYTLTFAALLLTAGALSDRYGGRRAFLAGLWLFVIFSGLSAVATSMGTLIALRALLGVAGALLLPTSLAIIAYAYTDPAARARAMGGWAAISGTALAAGPVVGGVLTDTLGWQSIFLLHIPVGLVSIALTMKYAPLSAPEPAKGVDLPGQITAVLALAALTYALIESRPKGWGSPEVLGGLAVFAVTGVLFVLAERREETAAHAPMLPLRMFRNRTLSAGLFAGLLVNFGLSGVLFVLSLFFQEAHGYSAFTAGLAFLPLTLPTAFNPIFTGRLVARIGARRPAIAGFLMMGAGVLIQSASTADSTGSLALMCAGLLVLGFGVSFTIPPLMTAIVGSVPKEQSGIASGALNSARQTGAVLGVAVLGAVIGGASSVTDGAKAALAVAGLVLPAGAGVVAAYLGRPAQDRA